MWLVSAIVSPSCLRCRLERHELYLRKPVLEHPDLPFYIYASNGYPRDIGIMTEQMKYLTKADGFSFGTDPAVNNIYFSISNFYHSDILVPQYYYNSLKVLFHL